MPETDYRASRICRILGNPSAYWVLKSLLKGSKSPTELSKELKVSVSTISEILRNLRNTDLVRYEVKSSEHIYWLKDPLIKEIVEKIERLVKKLRAKEW